tara:strand:- start:943 stop:1122 length:180 start_codon:yes stop_codon:yes gene_type:complete
MNNKYLSLFIILTITFLASAIGGFTTSAFKEPWYSQLTLAPFKILQHGFLDLFGQRYIF